MSEYQNVRKSNDPVPADERYQVFSLSESKAVSPEKTPSRLRAFLSRYENPDSIQKIVKGILFTGGVLGLAAIAGAVGMSEKARSERYASFMNQLRTSDQIGYVVQPGDSLLNCGYREGMNTEQSTYNTGFIEEQNGIGPSGTIYEGSEIKVPDFNRDGSVSCSSRK